MLLIFGVLLSDQSSKSISSAISSYANFGCIFYNIAQLYQVKITDLDRSQVIYARNNYLQNKRVCLYNFIQNYLFKSKNLYRNTSNKSKKLTIIKQKIDKVKSKTDKFFKKLIKIITTEKLKIKHQIKMFQAQPQSQFHTYPLLKPEQTSISNQLSQINNQILHNKRQITQLNKRFQNQQIHNVFINRLNQKNQILMLKKEELEYVNKLHNYHQQVNNNLKRNQLKINGNLANQYKYQIEQHRINKSKEKEQQRHKQRTLLQHNLRQIERIQKQKALQKSNMYINSYLQNQHIDTTHKNIKDQQRSSQINKFQSQYQMANSKPTQKQIAYRQFQNSNNVALLNRQNIYKSKTQQLNFMKQSQRNQIQENNQRQYMQQINKKGQSFNESVQVANKQLSAYLKSQITSNKQTRHSQYINSLQSQLHHQSSLIHNPTYNSLLHQSKLNQQKLYSSQLSKQYLEQLNQQQANQRRSKGHSYLDEHKVNQTSQIGKQKSRYQQHNPISNPISFGIGVTNPYILKEYQKRRSSKHNMSGLANIAENYIAN